MIEKTAKLLSKAKSIYAFIFAAFFGMYTIVTWAGDQRYMQISNHELNQVSRDLESLNNKIGEYRIKLQYATEQREKDMWKSLIINAETNIKNLKGE